MKKLLAAFAVVMAIGAVHSAQDTTATEPVDHPALASQIKRQPNLSPDGKTVAFVYDGDIWVSAVKGGFARRLTSTVDNEGSPKFSPDGKWLAYRSRRYGHDDVFVMPAEGGPGQRLTWSDGFDDPCCWLPDSSGVVFESWRRDYGADLHVVRLDGGEPWAITDGGFRESEFDASVSPDGKTIAYVRRGGSSSYRRRGYNGSSNNDIWLADFDGVSTSNHRSATSSRAHESWPVFVDDNTFLYVSFSDGVKKSSRKSHFEFGTVDGSSTRQSMHSLVDVREPTVAAGQVMFTTGHYGGWNLNQANLGGRKSNTPEIKIAVDDRTADVSHSTLNRVGEFAVSPDGKKVAFISGHDVWVMPLVKGATPRQITDTLHREKDLSWNDDSQQLIFSSRASGNFDVQVADTTNGEVRTVADTGANCAFAQFVPGAEEIIFVEGSSQIRTTDLVGRSSEIISDATYTGWNRWGGTAYEISSDGQWLLYERENENFDQDFWLLNLQTKKQTRATFQFGNVSSGSFSHDGKRINFVSNQEDDFDAYAIELQEKALEFDEDKGADLFKKPEDTKKDDGSDDKSADKTETKEKKDDKQPEVKIDLERLMERTTRLTTMDGHEWNPVSTDSKTTLFIGNSQGQTNIWKLTNEPGKGPNLKQLTTSRSKKENLRVGPNGKNVWFKDGSRIAQMNAGNGKVTYWDFKATHTRSKREMRLAAYDETVWAMESFFYDDQYHGQNWKHLAKTYRQALSAVGTGDEWGAVMNELFGELNSSHQGFYASDNRSDGGSESVGWLGLRFDQRELAKGLYRVEEVIKNGPCDREDVGIRAGDYIQEVDGVSITGKRLTSKLVWKIGKKVELGVTSGPDTKDKATKAIKPIGRSAWFELLYQRWVEKQREMVHKLSDGELGYVHIRGMNDPSLRHFKHQIGNDMLGKKGVVIDVRFNGGGYTAVHLLEILVKKTWLKRTARDRAGDVSENIYRSVALEKPSCLLINQDSFSNAEIMAEGFKRLKIGKVIGVETAGGVIGTSSYNLIDGSRMRMPVSGAYAVDGENLENNGREPDIEVDNTPNDINAGRDRQTEQAVKTLLEEIK
ncbi:MAG: S41 family peptidase [Planctomycetota bacterium]|jgi:tricorn protease